MALMELEDNILEKENAGIIEPCDFSDVTGEFPTEGDTGHVHGWGCTSVGKSEQLRGFQNYFTN